MELIFFANILVAGTVGILSLLFPETAARTVFQSTAGPSPAMTIAGAFWTAIAVLSLLGLFFPREMSAVLLVQLLYKGLWLLGVALPSVLDRPPRRVPMGIAGFFLIWVLVIPLVYPWSQLVSKSSP